MKIDSRQAYRALADGTARFGGQIASIDTENTGGNVMVDVIRIVDSDIVIAIGCESVTVHENYESYSGWTGDGQDVEYAELFGVSHERKPSAALAVAFDEYNAAKKAEEALSNYFSLLYGTEWTDCSFTDAHEEQVWIDATQRTCDAYDAMKAAERVLAKCEAAVRKEAR